MKIYAIRIGDDRWAFYAPPQPSDATLEPAPDSRWGRLMNRIRKLQAESSELMRTSEKRFWVWTRKMMAKLERLVHPCEPLSRALVKAESVELVHDGTGASEKLVASWCGWLNERTAAHKRGMILNACLLPFTSAATVIPGPNVFVAWNGLRLYNHWSAWRGTQRASALGCPGLTTDARLHIEGALTEKTADDLAARLEMTGLSEYLTRLKAVAHADGAAKNHEQAA